MANALYTAILEQANKGNKVQELVRQCFVINDQATITEAARMIDENPRFDKEQSRARLAGLRMAMQRVCKSMDLPKMTVKKAEGSWIVAVSDKKTDKATDFEAQVQKLVEKAFEEGQAVTLANLFRNHADAIRDMLNAEEATI